MDRQRLAIAASVYGAVTAILGAVIVIAEDELYADGRSCRRPRCRRFSMRQSLFAVADLNSAFDNGWFLRTFRCRKSSFESIYQLVEQKWDLINEEISHNAVFYIRDRVAVTLFYLTHAGSLSEAAQVFGMSKASASRYVKNVTDIIVDCLAKEIIRLPAASTDPEWDVLTEGFEAICGFPNCCLAIDGSLFEIERPQEFVGWYCRKGYPAINCQLVVDHKARIRDYDMRPGSANDKSIFNYSDFGNRISTILPLKRFIVGDAGYTLSNSVMIPYPIEERMDPKEALYNYLHSRTRIVVERSIGILKNRFRILKLPLNQKEDTVNGRTQAGQMARIMESCFVLHNLLIDLADEDGVPGPQVLDETNDADAESQSLPVTDAGVIRDCIARYLYDKRDLQRNTQG